MRDVEDRLDGLESDLERQRERLATREATGEAQRTTIEAQREVIRSQRERIAELDPTPDETPRPAPLSRRSAVKAGGLLALLGVGAGTASAAPSGRVGTDDRPLASMYTDAIDGPLTDGHRVDSLVGEGLTISNGQLTAGTDLPSLATLTVEPFPIEDTLDDQAFAVEVTVAETAGIETEFLTVTLDVEAPDGATVYEETIDVEDIQGETTTATFGEDGDTDELGPFDADADEYTATATADLPNVGTATRAETFIVFAYADLTVEPSAIDEKFDHETFTAAVTVGETADVRTVDLGVTLEVEDPDGGTVYEATVDADEIQDDSISVTFGVDDDTEEPGPFDARDDAYTATATADAWNAEPTTGDETFEVDPPFAGGDGSEADPYRIETWQHLDDVRLATGDEFVLTADLDANAAGYDEVASPSANGGDGFEPIRGFDGRFDGDGHVIEGLTIDREGETQVGLFGSSDGLVENVDLEDVDVTGSEAVGGLVGENGGDVRESDVTGAVAGIVHEATITQAIGGLVGENGGSVNASYSTVEVSASDNGLREAGGLVGRNTGEIVDSHATGDITGYEQFGGLVGYNSGDVRASSATGTVTGFREVGGLVGENDGDVSDSYATGDVSGHLWVGGFIGDNLGTVSESYATGDVDSEDHRVGGLVGANEGTVTVSFATGTVAADLGDMVGGLVGENLGTVSESYATGDVTGHTWVGGLVGFNLNPVRESYSTGQVIGIGGGLVGISYRSVSRSYWDHTNSDDFGADDGIGDGGEGVATGLETADMQGADLDTDFETDFDFDATWATVTGPDDYPVLQAIDEQTQLEARR